MRVGLYGGTFDPIHNGHIHVIQELISRKIVDHLLVLPAGQPRLRDNEPHATGAQRRAICQLAVAELPAEIKKHVEVNPIEVLREGPSYTIDTVESLMQTYPEVNFTLVIGSDTAQHLDKWHRSADLLKLVKILVIKRPATPPSDFEEISIKALDISSTQVRKSISNRENVSNLLPPKVVTFIREYGLYGSR